VDVIVTGGPRPPLTHAMRRRTFLAGTAAMASTAAAGAWLRTNDPARAWLSARPPARVWSAWTNAARSAIRNDPPPRRPSAPAGTETLTRRFSTARGRTVDFYTAVPAGYGDGRGLPVCFVLHGASKRPPDYPSLGLGGFLTDSVRRGRPPFVLAGATGDLASWPPQSRLLHADLPAWCAALGFDTSRRAAWGWSMGGYGALRLAETFPSFLRGVAAFSPAVTPGDAVFTGVAQLAGTPIGLWCGGDDPLCLDVQTLSAALPTPPTAGGYAPGRHNFSYWSTQIPAAFDFIAETLGRR
jgi:hypothetical protein